MAHRIDREDGRPKDKRAGEIEQVLGIMDEWLFKGEVEE